MKALVCFCALSVLLCLLTLPVAAEFPDVPDDYWAWAEIEGCVDAGIVSGYDDGYYQPNWPVTRDQMAVYIARTLAEGEANVPTGPAEATFDDVPDNFWAYDHVEYCYDQNVVQGFTATTYEPTLQVTRDQMAVYVARAMLIPTGEAALDDYVPSDPRNFPDVPDTFWAYKHIEYCVEHDVVMGYDDGNYYPTNPVTRDQMAVYITRAFELAIPIQTFDVTDYFNLTQGNRWDSMTADGPTRLLASGTSQIGGQTYVRLSDPQGFTNYLRLAPEGLYMAGIDNDGDEYRFTPALLIPNDIAVGQEVIIPSNLYLNGADQGSGSLRLVLVRRENVSLPAGNFPCLVLEWETTFPAIPNDHIYIWVAKGMGIVKQDEEPVGGSYWEKLYSASVSSVRYPQTYNLSYYYPLEEGDTWNYGPVGNTFTETVSGTAVLRGRTFVRTVDTYNNEVSYYQSTPEGIYFGGEYRDGETMALEPPFLFPSGMALEESRDATASMYINDALQGSMSATLTLLGEEDVTVPAGFFPSCLKFELYVDMPDSSYVHQLEWWAAGVGSVKFDETAFGGEDYDELLSGTIGGISYP